MERYNHSQFGVPLAIIIGGVAVLVLAGLYQNKEGFEVVGVVFLVMALILSLFYKLTIKVENDIIRWAFGIGLINKQLAISEIKSTQIVENPWYCGWGIRMMSEGTLYNISGFQAVNLELKDGTHIRLGTDDPHQLKVVIDTYMSEK